MKVVLLKCKPGHAIRPHVYVTSSQARNEYTSRSLAGHARRFTLFLKCISHFSLFHTPHLCSHHNTFPLSSASCCYFVQKCPRNASVDYHEDPGTVLTMGTGRTVHLLPPLMEPTASGADSEGLTQLPQGGRGSCGSSGWEPLTLTLMSRECFPEQVTTDLRLLTQWAPATLNNSQVLE